MKRRWSGLQAVRIQMADDSSSEVTSSSAAVIMSPANSLASTDIADVDLEFWDLDLNGQHHPRGLTVIPTFTVNGQTVLAHARSDTSGSVSGILSFLLFKNSNNYYFITKFYFRV